MSPQVVTPGVFWHASPFLPVPLGRQANVPDVSFAEQVWPAGQENGFEAHPDDAPESLEEEQASTAEEAATRRTRAEVVARMPRRLHHRARSERELSGYQQVARGSNGRDHGTGRGTRLACSPRGPTSRPRSDAMHVRIRMSQLAAVLCSLSIVPATAVSALAQEPSPPAPAPQEPAPPEIPKDQLDSVVAPIALYPDPLLAQVLAASTYPLEIVQLQQWLDQHKDLKDQALIDAVQKENWDPSVQSLAVLPDVVKFLAGDIKWTTDLGNAFLAQQSDVMEAVQRMRAKAQKSGNLKSNEQMKVETKTVEKETVVVIEQADPQVVYVPSYNPTVVYGPAPYPYPAIAYPPPGAYVAGAMISFGVGIAVGAAFHGGWGYNCGWGGAPQQHRHHQPQQQLRQNQQRSRRRAGRRREPRAVAAQSSTPWRRALREPGDREQIRRRRRRATPREHNKPAAVGSNLPASGSKLAATGGKRRRRDRGAKRQPAGEGRAGGGAEPRAERGGASEPRRGGAEQRADRGGAGGGAAPRAAERGATDSNRVGNRSASPSAGGGGSRGGGDALGGGSRGSYSGSDARSSSARGSSSAGARGGAAAVDAAAVDAAAGGGNKP